MAASPGSLRKIPQLSLTGAKEQILSAVSNALRTVVSRCCHESNKSPVMRSQNREKFPAEPATQMGKKKRRNCGEPRSAPPDRLEADLKIQRGSGAHRKL